MRKFEKISKSEFKKFFPEALYDSVVLPRRSTALAAGYDFFLVEDLTIPAGKSAIVPTGIKATFPGTEFLMIVIRSSTGFKHHPRLLNQVGIIDSDYYNNPENEGHLFLALENLGSNDKTFRAGDRLCQGIFLPYLVCDDDLPKQNRRIGKY